MASDDDAPDGRRRATFTKSGRLGRMMRIGSLAASVAGSAVARRMGASLKSDEAKRDALRDSLVGNAEKVVRTMGEMKGAAMKLGQMLSAAPEALPREFMEQIKSLQHDSPSMDFEMVSQQIERSLGRPLVDVFRYFDPEPVGAASIGQVHEAKLFDGRRVAVKVQYPGIADTLDSDLKNIGSVLSMGRVIADKAVLDAFLQELRVGIIDEANYELEADNLRKYGAILEKHPRVVAPKVIDDLSSEHVLTMEFLEGKKLDVAIDAMTTREERDEIGFAFSEIFVWMFHEQFVLHADPHPGNFLLMPDGKIGFLDFGCMREYDAQFCDGWLDILIAKWTHDREGLPAIFERLGYRGMRGNDGATAKQLDELCEIILQPFLYDREFDWGPWHPERQMQTFVKGNLNIIQYAAPPRAVFYFRVAAGIWGFLQRSSIRGNWYHLARETAQRRGKLG